MESTDPGHNPREESRGPETPENAAATSRMTASGNRLAQFSLRYPVTICMIFVLFITLGVISIFKIPLVMMPAMDWPFLNIGLAYPNATPLQVLESITKPLEEVLSTVPGSKQMRSRASSGSANVNLTFGWEQDLDARRAEIRDKIDQIRDELPDDIEHIWITRKRSSRPASSASPGWRRWICGVRAAVRSTSTCGSMTSSATASTFDSSSSGSTISTSTDRWAGSSMGGSAMVR